MRVILAVALLVSCMWAGAARQSRMRARVSLLAALQRDIEALADAMELSPRRLKELLEGLHSPELAAFWARFASRLAEKERVEALWRILVTEERAAGTLRQLTAQDEAVLRRVGDSFALPGKEAQLSRLAYHARELGRQRAAAEAELLKKGKMASALGTLIGLALALMVI